MLNPYFTESMQQLRINDLSFALPQRWEEVTTDQYLRLAKATTSRQRLQILSNLNDLLLQGFTPPDIESVVFDYLRFIKVPVHHQALPVPATLRIGKRTVKLRLSLWHNRSVAQGLDVRAGLNAIGERQGAETLPLVDVAELLLSTYLSPPVLKQRYMGEDHAGQCWALIKDLPCTDLLPLAAALLSDYKNPPPNIGPSNLTVSPGGLLGFIISPTVWLWHLSKCGIRAVRLLGSYSRQ